MQAVEDKTRTALTINEANFNQHFDESYSYLRAWIDRQP
jgi:hypothetical protein